jgi:type II secretory pathway component PulF
MEGAPGIFLGADIAAMRAAEQLGEPAQGFESIATRLDAADLFGGELRRTLFYPLSLLFGAVLSAPAAHLFQHHGTAYLREVRGPLVGLFAGALLLSRGLPRLLRSPVMGGALRRLFCPVLWRLPFFGGLYLSHLRAVFCRVMARNLSQGLLPQQALLLAIETTADPVAHGRRDKIMEWVRSGRDLPTTLVKAGLCHPDDLLLLSASGHAGLLDAALLTAADRCTVRLRTGVGRLRLFVNLLLSAAVLFWAGRGLYRSYQAMNEDLGGEVEQMLKVIGRGLPLPADVAGLF